MVDTKKGVEKFDVPAIACSWNKLKLCTILPARLLRFLLDNSFDTTPLYATRQRWQKSVYESIHEEYLFCSVLGDSLLLKIAYLLALSLTPIPRSLSKGYLMRPVGYRSIEYLAACGGNLLFTSSVLFSQN